MEKNKPLVFIAVALTVAGICVTVLWNMDFGRNAVAQDDGMNEISRAALARVGATEAPTQLNE